VVGFLSLTGIKLGPFRPVPTNLAVAFQLLLSVRSS
jgi:hypothetical protein